MVYNPCLSLSMYVYIYIYMHFSLSLYIYIYTHTHTHALLARTLRPSLLRESFARRYSFALPSSSSFLEKPGTRCNHR